ncbi:MAG TPA: branched-chain amino acid transaminase [Anaerolineales bacterium]|nr:branched-chain amino acid transaminase [Anaerolineales bacterium]
MMNANYIWRNGKIIPFGEATVHVLNPTMHYGPGVFEGIRCYHGRGGSAVFRLQDHLERFFRSIHILGIENLPYDIETLRQAVHQTIQVNGFSECYIRPFMYLEGPMGLNLDRSTPSFAIAVWEWGPYLGEEAFERGATMMVSSFTRMHPNASMTKAKIGGQYVNSMLAKTLALRSGFDEAVLLDPEGFVAEGTGENLFIVAGERIYTPPAGSILDGITRDTVIALSGDLGYSVVERRISRDQLYTADEVFVAGTAVEITPIREIDFRTIATGARGPVTAEIQQAFFDTVRGHGLRSDEYLDYVSRTDAVLEKGTPETEGV